MVTLQFGLKYGTVSHILVVGFYLVSLFLLCVTLDFFISFLCEILGQHITEYIQLGGFFLAMGAQLSC